MSSPSSLAQHPTPSSSGIDIVEENGHVKLVPDASRAAPDQRTAPRSVPTSDLTALQSQQKFYGAPWPQPELNFTPGGAGAVRAGDVNNDGTEDWLYPVASVGDERTADPSDRTPKTFLRFGGGDFSAQYYDELYYRSLQPVGNVVGSSHADAIRFLDGGQDGIQLFRGTDQGYTEGAVLSETGLSSVVSEKTPPVDLNGDGYDDIVQGGVDQIVPETVIEVTFGAETEDALTSGVFTPAYDSSRAPVFSYTAGDVDGDEMGEIVRLTGNNVPNGPDDSLTVDVFGLDDDQLVQQQSVTVDFPEGTTGATLTLANVDGSGLQELILRTGGSTLVLPAEGGTYQETPVSYYLNSRPIGDVNGDGRTDFALRDTSDGSPYIAFGPSSVSDGLDFDLPVPNGPDDASITLPSQEAWADADGDGRDELIATYTGESQFGPRLLDLPEGASDLATTDLLFDQSAYATDIGVQQTVNVGDWNDDGTDDVGFVRTNGRVDIYYGDPTQAITPDVTLTGPSYAFGGANYSSIAAGDFTGNGTPNLAVAWESNAQTVAVYEAGGGDSPLHTIGIEDLGIPVDAPGIAGSEAFPNSVVANLGDINGDGTDDLGVTVPVVEGDMGHKVFLYYGASGLSTQPDVTVDYSDRATGDYFGQVLRGVGDINGDGTDDFLVGDTFSSYSGGSLFPPDPIENGFFGALFVHFGDAGSSPTFDTPDQALAVPLVEPVSGGAFRINQGFGFQGIAVGDFNGDDTTDVAAKPAFSSLNTTGNGTMALRVFHGGSDFDGTPDATLPIPGIMDSFSDTQLAGLNFAAVTGIPSATADGPDRILLETWNPSNALLYGPGPDTTYTLEQTTLLRGPDQYSGLGVGGNFIDVPQNGASAVGDFNGSGQPNVVLPQLQSVDYRGQPAYAYELGEGAVDDPPPAADATQPVDSSSTTVDFGDSTGVDIAFSESTSGSGTVTVERFDEGPSGASGISESTVSSYRVEISAEGLSVGDSTRIRFDASMLPGISNPDRVTIYTRELSGIGSFQEVATSYDADAEELVAFVTGFSEFAFASDTEPLPVEMAGFDATVNGEAVQLSWQTASETNNARFQIQRRAGEGTNGRGGAWTTVGSVEGNGTTSQAQSYRFTDGDLPYAADMLDYRLKQVDVDGSTSYSKTLTVDRTVTTVELLGTYPNPAQNRATVRYALPEKQAVTLRLYDVLGRRVKTLVHAEQSGRHKRRVDLAELSSGVYFLRLQSRGTVRTQKLTVVR